MWIFKSELLQSSKKNQKHTENKEARAGKKTEVKLSYKMFNLLQFKSKKFSTINS